MGGYDDIFLEILVHHSSNDAQTTLEKRNILQEKETVETNTQGQHFDNYFGPKQEKYNSIHLACSLETVLSNRFQFLKLTRDAQRVCDGGDGKSTSESLF